VAGTGSGRPTGHDVARLAGVSQATVSLVFSGPPGSHSRVSAATRERVLAAAERLGYRPQAAGRQLRLGRSGMLLLAVPNILGPFFSRVLDGAHTAAGEQDLTVVVSSGWTEATIRQAAMTGQFDGLLICSPDDSQLGELPMDVPVVFLDADPALGDGDRRLSIGLDVAGGMRAAVHHLRELGHRRLGHLRSVHTAHTFRSRQAAFAEATEGIEVIEVGVAINGGLEATRAAARELLDRPDRPGAVVCDDDVVAAGTYQAAAALGLGIPDDLSVVGIDNIAVAELLTPPLTTVDLPGERLGRVGVEALSALLAGARGPVCAPLPAPLILRASTRPA
jgi:LacI family repressor for deo operon, udp, cdd, tsx, nupC, and nupG